MLSEGARLASPSPSSVVSADLYGTGMVRDENGIHMVTCGYCEGKGRAPQMEELS
jgi:hypothetical protein